MLVVGNWQTTLGWIMAVGEEFYLVSADMRWLDSMFCFVSLRRPVILRERCWCHLPRLLKLVPCVHAEEISL